MVDVRGGRVRAPEPTGRDWLNTGGAGISLADLRGRIVVLDFWTFCCVNCLHVLDELRDLERRHADVLVVVGVHSPKFAHEADPAALRAAVERYGVEHPVLDDPELGTWRQYAVRAWPTLVVIDPEGYVVATMSGEGHAHALDVLVSELVAEHGGKGTLRRGDSPYVPPEPTPGTLRFPSHVVALDDGSLLVADPGHHAISWLEPDGVTLRRRIGTGAPGAADGSAAAFREPHGLSRLPADVAAAVGYDVVVADTGNHLLRGLSTATGRVTTVAGTGLPWRRGDTEGSGPWRATGVPLSSPWDVVWFDGRLAVAMAGTHQLWWFDPVRAEAGLLAGTTNEGLVDGVAAQAWLAQPSALAVSGDGLTLWFIDAETSALRRLRNGVVTTAVGRGLFEFGHVDGAAADALLQHPLGLAVLPDGSLAVADTYNGAVRRFEPDHDTVTTLATGLAEPTGLLGVPSDDDSGSALVVVESAAHRLVRVALPDHALHVAPASFRTARPPAEVAAGAVELRVPFLPPTGQKLDDRLGPATHLVVSASPPGLLVEGGGSSTSMTRRLVLADPAVSGIPSGVLHVSARAASCDDPDAPGAAEFPACHVHQQDWGVPVVLTPDGDRVVELPLSG